MSKILPAIVVVLAIVIVVMAYILFTTPGAPAAMPLEPATTTPSTSTTQVKPLHDRVIISSPKPNGLVRRDFEVVGEAPGAWYFEASFPIQVRGKDGNVIARTHANSIGDWMIEGQVAFKASVHIDSYQGPATLVLMKDNPSGLPENDDAVEIPITVVSTSGSDE